MKNIHTAAELLPYLSPHETVTERVSDRPGHEFKYCLNFGMIHYLGWKPQVGFEEGLQKTID